MDRTAVLAVDLIKHPAVGIKLVFEVVGMSHHGPVTASLSVIFIVVWDIALLGVQEATYSPAPLSLQLSKIASQG